MTIEEVKKFLKRIDMNYQTNLSEDKDIVREWHTDLKNYSNEDLDKSLNEYMKSNYASIPPKRWALLNDLKTIEQKEALKDIYETCIFCGKKVPSLEYKKHHGRCLDIAYLIKNGKKFLNKDWNKEQFYKMNDAELEDKVIKMQLIVYDKTTNLQEKAMLEIYLKRIKAI